MKKFKISILHQHSDRRICSCIVESETGPEAKKDGQEKMNVYLTFDKELHKISCKEVRDK